MADKTSDTPGPGSWVLQTVPAPARVTTYRLILRGNPPVAMSVPDLATATLVLARLNHECPAPDVLAALQEARAAVEVLSRIVQSNKGTAAVYAEEMRAGWRAESVARLAIARAEGKAND